MKEAMDYDVLVCGAGPAGANAARLLAAGGLRVALIEKQHIGRHKTCGGGMPTELGRKYQALLPEAFVEARVDYFSHSFHFKDHCLHPLNYDGSSKNSLWMVQRTLFDASIAELAAQAGAEVIEHCSLRAIELLDAGVKATFRSTIGSRATRTLRARHLIGADGANGQSARSVGLRPKRELAIGMELELEHEWGRGIEILRKDVAHLEFGAITHGYAWVFPKNDHLNIGAGKFYSGAAGKESTSALKARLKDTIHEYCRYLEIDLPRNGTYYAHPLPVWSEKEPLQTSGGEVLLVGDAAGMVNPFFGDGILHAMQSAEFAADCILKERPHRYTELIAAKYERNNGSARRWAKWFYQHPQLFYSLGVKREEASSIASRILAGEIEFQEIPRRTLKRLMPFTSRQ